MEEDLILKEEEEVEKMQELKKLCLEMLEYSVKSMHGMLFNNDI